MEDFTAELDSELSTKLNRPRGVNLAISPGYTFSNARLPQCDLFHRHPCPTRACYAPRSPQGASSHAQRNPAAEAVRPGRRPGPFAGIGQGFEATLNWRVHDGHDERTGFFNVGGGTGEHGQFQVAAAIGAAAFQLDRLFVEVFEESAQDGSEINKVIVPVIYGPRIVANYIGFRIHA